MDLRNTFETVRLAARSLNLLSNERINEVLLALAVEAENQVDYILTENQKDLDLMEKSNPLYDRLLLNRERIEGIANDIRNVATLPSPLGRLLMETTRPNGMKISKISVPFGVIGIIYEDRPNVSFDVFSLCLKSANSCSSEEHTSELQSHYEFSYVFFCLVTKHHLHVL